MLFARSPCVASALHTVLAMPALNAWCVFVVQENLHSWMTDKMARDQFAIRFGDDTAVMWNDGKRCRADEVYKRTFWTESFVQWSPLGNMLATIHRQGVAVWGGPKFNRLMRYSHPGVQLIEFSTAEKYLMAYSSIEPHNPRESMTILLSIFDSRSGRKLRVFEGPMEEFAVGSAAGPSGSLKWPFFKWAGGLEDNYFARLGRNMISVYSTPDMVLLDKKSLRLEGVQDFEWSPAEPILAVYTTEQGNLPARIQLIKIPERTEIRQKNLFSVSGKFQQTIGAKCVVCHACSTADYFWLLLLLGIGCNMSISICSTWRSMHPAAVCACLLAPTPEST